MSQQSSNLSPIQLTDRPQWEYKGGSKSISHWILNYKHTHSLGAYSILLQPIDQINDQTLTKCYGPNNILKNKEMLTLLKLASKATRETIINKSPNHPLITWVNPSKEHSLDVLKNLKTLLQKIELNRHQTLINKIGNSSKYKEIHI